MKHTFTVIIERQPEGGYVASVAELPGCLTQGETLREVRRNIREAIALYLDADDAPRTFPTFVRVERVEV